MICKACKKEIPEESIFCMYCGKKQIYTPKKAKGRGNGQGSVYQLPNGKWRAVVTLGYVDGKRKTRAKTFDKKSDAIMCLPTLCQNTDIVPSMTFKECYDKMMEQHEKEITNGTYRNYKSNLKWIEPLFTMKMCDIRLEHLQSCIDSAKLKNTSKKICKIIIMLTFRFAMKNDIIQKDYSQYIVIGKDDGETREAFSAEDIKKIKEQADDGNQFAQYVMCLIFTGFRVGELFALKKEDFYDGCLHGGSKTDMGKNRIVPISPIILPYVERRSKGYSEYLFPSSKGAKMNTSYFSNTIFPTVMKECGIEGNFVPHCCRHTFATLCNKTNSNDFAARKRLIGHTDLQTTARYTHTDIEDMRTLINQLTID